MMLSAGRTATFDIGKKYFTFIVFLLLFQTSVELMFNVKLHCKKSYMFSLIVGLSQDLDDNMDFFLPSSQLLYRMKMRKMSSTKGKVEVPSFEMLTQTYFIFMVNSMLKD